MRPILAGFEVNVAFFFGLLAASFGVDGGEGEHVFFVVEEELGDNVILQRFIPLRSMLQLILLIITEDHINHLIVKLKVLLLKSNDIHQFLLRI